MKERAIKDVQSFTYDVGGQKVNVTFVEYDEPSGKHHGGNDMGVTIDVDGVNRLTCDDHFSTIADFGIGEYMIQPVLSCLASHLAYWINYQQFQLLLDDEYLPEQIECSAPMPVFVSNLAARHIEQLNDHQAWWWMSDPRELSTGPDNGAAVAEFLVGLAAEKWTEFTTSNEDKLKQLIPPGSGLTNPQHW